MSDLLTHIYLYGSDNYGVLLHDPSNNLTACIDTGDAAATLNALKERGWSCSDIWITHHHGDHTAGVAEVKAATGAKVLGPSYSSIGAIDQSLSDGDQFNFGDHQIQVIHTPGHTTDMLNFYIPSQKMVFTGDTLFTLGCGRLFESDPETMWHSLQKLLALPADTMVYSSHEYTLANAAFALSVDPENSALQARAEEFKRVRDQHKPTVPSLLADEMATNPFLRPDSDAIRQQLGMLDNSDAEVFGEIRARKDAF